MALLLPASSNVGIGNGTVSKTIRFVFIIVAQNNEKNMQKLVHRIAFQNHRAWRILFVDNNSKDGTFSSFRKAVDAKQVDPEKVKSYRFTQPHFTAASCRWFAFAKAGQQDMKIADNDVLVFLDGCDFLLEDDVLSKLAEVYQSDKVMMTYGRSTRHMDGILDSSRQVFGTSKIPGSLEEIRSLPYVFSALRTCRAKLLRDMPKSHIQLPFSFPEGTQREGNTSVTEKSFFLPIFSDWNEVFYAIDKISSPSSIVQMDIVAVAQPLDDGLSSVDPALRVAMAHWVRSNVSEHHPHFNDEEARRLLQEKIDSLFSEEQLSTIHSFFETKSA